MTGPINSCSHSSLPNAELDRALDPSVTVLPPERATFRVRASYGATLYAVLVDAQAVGANAKDATSNLGDLRADVEASLRKVDGMLAELNRKWPFAKKEAEVKLP